MSEVIRLSKRTKKFFEEYKKRALKENEKTKDPTVKAIIENRTDAEWIEAAIITALDQYLIKIYREE